MLNLSKVFANQFLSIRNIEQTVINFEKVIFYNVALRRSLENNLCH